MEPNQDRPAVVPPLMRNPYTLPMLAIVPAIVIALVLPAPIGIYIAVVLFIGQFATLYRVGRTIRERIEKENPGIFDRPAGPASSGPLGSPVDDPPQGPIIS